MIRPRMLLAGIIMTALVIASSPAYADGVGIGAKIGPLFPKFSGENLTNLKNGNGWMGGIWFGGNRAGTIGVEGELMYAKKSIPDALGRDNDLYYLEIPILLRINVGSSNRERVAGYILAGPAADIRLKAKLNGVDVSDNYEGFDLGIIGGAGIEITRFLVEAQYNWGLRNVVAGNLANLNKIKTRTFTIQFGVRFN